MLKTVSSIANAIGALNYKGTWDANANVPPLASGVGTKGDYYVVGTAGSTTLDGISNWGIGDWAVFNGSVWQRVEGGADLNGVNLSVTGTSTLSALTASTALALDASKNIVSVTNTGTGDNVLATSPSLITPTLGVATATSINKVTLTAPATASTLTIANNKTLTANNSLTLAGTDATTMTFPATNATVARTDAGQSFTGTQVLRANTASGTVASATSGVGQTLFDVTAIGAGLYHVVAYIGGVPSAAYAASATVQSTGVDAVITAINGSLMTLTLSGTNVQATQSSGSAQNIQFAYFRIAQ